MNPIDRPRRLCLMLLAGWLAPALPVLASPPDGAGKHGKSGKGLEGHGHKPRPKQALDDRVDPRAGGSGEVGKGTRMGRKPLPPGAYFNDRNRKSVRAYYAKHPGKGCPPGLAKKNNGCLPPGQARQWRIGHALPGDVVVMAVPQPVRVLLPRVPPGHQYVQVAGDILLIAIGSKMVVDGIEGLMR